MIKGKILFTLVSCFLVTHVNAIDDTSWGDNWEQVTWTYVPLDTDGDGVPDDTDIDDDNDGVLDVNDVFPKDATETLDSDLDGIGDNTDTDDDNDGHSDEAEIAAGTDPFNANDFPIDGTQVRYIPIINGGITLFYPQTCATNGDNVQDNDLDGYRDFCDPDDDNDGVLDELDALPLDETEQVDTDGDGIGNNTDTDDDNDGQSDQAEIDAGTDPLDITSSPNLLGLDSTQIKELHIPIMNGGITFFINDELTCGVTEEDKRVDHDKDTYRNFCDPDDDNDGVVDAEDAFPLDRTETIDTDKDGIGNNADTDDDGDNIPDDIDPQPLYCDASLDFEGDGLCDHYDDDDDNDWVSDADEAILGSNPKDRSDPFPTAAKDSDGDGVVDLDDDCPLNLETPNLPNGTVDADDDGICEDGTDLSQIPIADFQHLIDSGQTKTLYIPNSVGDVTFFIPKILECITEDTEDSFDTDKDGYRDFCDIDIDGDNYVDNEDAIIFNPELTQDTDGDGIANIDDEDDDNDGVNDIDEHFLGTDPLVAEIIPADDDGDGVINENDACPNNPWGVEDTDADGECEEVIPSVQLNADADGNTTTLVGSLEVGAEVASGQLDVSVPFNVPSGVHGFTPSVGINYRSDQDNGYLGIGFELAGLSQIGRCAATEEIDGVRGRINFDSEDRYCLDGQRLMLITGSLGEANSEYRLRNSTASKIELLENTENNELYWQVWLADGNILKFGTTANAVENISNKGILNWYLSSREDRFGNSIDYTYEQHGNMPRLQSVDYSIHKIEFLYQTRPDTFTAYRLGQEQNLDERLYKVEVKTNDQLLREYQLGYEQSDAGLSYLETLTLCDGQGDCIRPTQFNWKQLMMALEGGPTTLSQVDIATTTTFSNYTFADLDRDGDTDICYIEGDLYCGLNDGEGGYSYTQWSTLPESSWSSTSTSASLSLQDMNGDLYPDYCLVTSGGLYCGENQSGNSFNNSAYWTTEFTQSDNGQIRYTDINDDRRIDICLIGNNGIQCANNNGSGFDALVTLSNEAWPETLNGTDNTSPNFMDINSDGFIDVCGLDNTGFRCNLGNEIINDNMHFAVAQYWSTNLPSVTSANYLASFRYSDLNADGLTDICYRESADVNCALNTGETFNASTLWFQNISALYDTNSNTLNLYDIDADGRTDLCFVKTSYQYVCAINQGSGFANEQVVMNMQVSEDQITLPVDGSIRLRDYPIRVADINGDAGLEICYRSLSGISCGRSNNPKLLLSDIKTAYGNETKVDYAVLNKGDLYISEADRPEQGLYEFVPSSIVVKTLSTGNGAGGFNTMSYRYGGQKWHEDRGARGFRLLERTHSGTGVKSVTEYYQTGEETDGQVERQRNYLNDILLSETNSEYEVRESFAGKVVEVLSKETINSTYEYNTESLVQTEKQRYLAYDSFGNLVNSEIIRFDANGVEQHKQITTSTYWSSETNWLNNKPEDITVEHLQGAEIITRNTSFTYYPETGALKSETIEPTSSLALISEFEYDEHGNRDKTTVKDIHGEERASHVVFDANGLLPTLQENALGHQENIEYDPLCLLPTKQTGPNGLSTHWRYDSLCRKRSEKRPDSTYTYWTYNWSPGYNLGQQADDRSVFIIKTETDGQADVILYYDSLEREVRSETIGFSGDPVYQDKIYDTMGRLERATLPYFAGFFPGDNTNWAVTEYDDIGRVNAQHKPNDGGEVITTTFGYDGLKSWSIDAEGRTKTVFKDLFGRDKRIEEQADDQGGLSVIVNTYDAIGNLHKVDVNGIITVNNYNERGQKVDMDDPSMGYWEYEYNAFGELTYQIDAKLQITDMEYDALGRLEKRIERVPNPEIENDPTAESYIVTTSEWKYDTADNGIGKLQSSSMSSVANGEVTKDFYYDDLGRLQSEDTEIDGKQFITSVEYDKFSRVKTELNPDGAQIKREYSEEGFLKAIYMPKEQVWDYDYSVLESSLQGFTLALKEAEDLAIQHEEEYLKYLRVGNRYLLYAMHFELMGDVAAARASELSERAEALLEHADQHRRDAEHYRSLASYYRRIFNDHFFDHVATSSSYARYQLTACVRRGGKRNKCKQYQTWNVNLAFNLLPNNCSAGTVISTQSSCWYGPPRRINLGRYFSNLSNSQMALSQQYAAEAAVSTQQATVYSKYATLFHDKADEYYALAEEQLELARAETDELRVMLELTEDYQATIAAIEGYWENEESPDDNNVLIWEATSRDAAGRLSGNYTGNGLLTKRFYDPYSGRLRRIWTGVAEPDANDELAITSTLRDLNYQYDGVDSVKSRQDLVLGTTETFVYDELDRLKTSTFSQGDITTQTLEYRYDIHGNMERKDGVGTMYYDDANRLNQLTRVDGSSSSYTYDANGNMTSSTTYDVDGNSISHSSNRSIKWTSFNKPDEITDSNEEVTKFVYDSERNRIKQSIGGKTIYYVSKGFEYHEDIFNTTKDYKHYIYADGQAVALHVRRLEGDTVVPDTFRYLHHDALGSVDTITDSHGVVVAQDSYDPWGKRQGGISSGIAAQTERGYTGHEHLDDLGLIHMNARIYDPEIGRFLSADIYVPYPDMSQSYNRYSYVINNPLKYTDPSGHIFGVLFGIGIGLFVAGEVFDIPILKQVGIIAASIGTGGYVKGLSLASTAFGNAVIAGAAAGFTGSFLSSGGDLKAGFKGAIFGGISGGIADKIGGSAFLQGLGKVGDISIGAALAHGVTQGLIAELRGGSFENGFVSGFISKVSPAAAWAARAGAGDLTVPNIELRTLTAALFGGLASVATGGDFVDGAITAATVHLFNAESRNCSGRPCGNRSIPKQYGDGVDDSDIKFTYGLQGGLRVGITKLAGINLDLDFGSREVSLATGKEYVNENYQFGIDLAGFSFSLNAHRNIQIHSFVPGRDSIHGILRWVDFEFSPVFSTPWSLSASEFWKLDFGVSALLGIEGSLDFVE